MLLLTANKVDFEPIPEVGILSFPLTGKIKIGKKNCWSSFSVDFMSKLCNSRLKQSSQW